MQDENDDDADADDEENEGRARNKKSIAGELAAAANVRNESAGHRCRPGRRTSRFVTSAQTSPAALYPRLLLIDGRARHSARNKEPPGRAEDADFNETRGNAPPLFKTNI